jgi:predicted glycogen debranching enzyme
MTRPVQPGWRRGEPRDALLRREWLVTNGLGGYACGTLSGACTRRFHGYLVAAMPAPLGRVMMLNHLDEHLIDGDATFRLAADEAGQVNYPDDGWLEEFVLEAGLPVWRWSNRGIRLEKRVVMAHLQNTTYIAYRLLESQRPITLELRPALHFRPHEGLLDKDLPPRWTAAANDHGVEISDHSDFPPLRLHYIGEASLQRDEERYEHVRYRVERSRGYEHEGPLWSPGTIRFTMTAGGEAGVIASVEPWDVVRAMTTSEACGNENARRRRLLSIAKTNGDDLACQLVLAADQFLISPRTRAADEARAYAVGDDPRTVIAGYHWFTDWGRDTMISLEGLTLVTGRHREAGNILRTFASYIRDGLIPNLFPEGEHGGLYHTADATMWFFHAVQRYVQHSGDRATLRGLLPKMIDIIDHHVRGTRFGIHVDPKDGLLAQGAEGYQLTWMDAKVGDWVVTPRRGKAVEINALYYNALRILQAFLEEEGDHANARRMDGYASRARKSFNERFWFADGQYLYDVLDPQDTAFRPNQIFAVALDHPVLDESRWARVVGAVEERLLTPAGLRSLSRDHPDYKPYYDGDLRARDAAYHQGTVWAWLIGPFIDAWRKVHRDDARARRFLDAFAAHMGDNCIGTIAEIFDAEPPYHPRGCVAQAWSVAEVLRCLHALDATNRTSG